MPVPRRSLREVRPQGVVLSEGGDQLSQSLLLLLRVLRCRHETGEDVRVDLLRPLSSSFASKPISPGFLMSVCEPAKKTWEEEEEEVDEEQEKKARPQDHTERGGHSESGELGRARLVPGSDALCLLECLTRSEEKLKVKYLVDEEVRQGVEVELHVVRIQHHVHLDTQ